MTISQRIKMQFVQIQMLSLRLSLLPSRTDVAEWLRAWDTLTMFEAGGREFDPRPGHYSRMSFSSDQVTGTVFSHLNMPFLPNSEFI